MRTRPSAIRLRDLKRGWIGTIAKFVPQERRTAVLEMATRAMMFFAFYSGIEFRGLQQRQLGRREQRALLKKLSKTGRAFDETVLAVHEQDFWTREVLEHESPADLPDLVDHAGTYASLVANAAERALRRVPETGAIRPPRGDRRGRCSGRRIARHC